MIIHLFTATAISLATMAFASLYRAYSGPTPADRVVSINVISTKITVMIVLIALIIEQDSFVDVALVYAMMGFITTVSVAKYLEKGKLF